MTRIVSILSVVALCIGIHSQAAELPEPVPGLAGLIEELNVSEAQKTQIAGILKAERTALQANVDAVLKARAELRAAIQADAFDEAAIRRASQAVAAAEEELAVQRGRLSQAVRAELTAEQRQTLNTRRDEFRGRLTARLGAVRRLVSGWIDRHAG